MVDLQAQNQFYWEGLKNKDINLAQLKIQLAVLDEVERYINSNENTVGLAPSLMGIDNDLLQILLPKLYAKEEEYNKRKMQFLPSDEMLQILAGEIEVLKKSILANVREIRKSINIGISSQERDIQNQLAALGSLPQKERMLLDISRQQSIKNAIYSFLLEKREEAAISVASTVSDLRIIQKSQANYNPVSPKKKLVYSIAGLLSVVVPFVVVLMKEQLNTTIQFRSDIEARTKLPKYLPIKCYLKLYKVI